MVALFVHQRSYSAKKQALSPVSTRMGDRLRAGIPSTQPCIHSRLINEVGYHPWLAGVQVRMSLCHLCRVAGKTIWSHKTCEFPLLRNANCCTAFTWLYFKFACRWRMDGICVLQEGGRLVLRNGGGRGTLELSVARLVAADASNYSCSAINDVGQSRRTAVLTVHCKLTSHHTQYSTELPALSRFSVHHLCCSFSYYVDAIYGFKRNASVWCLSFRLSVCLSVCMFRLF